MRDYNLRIVENDTFQLDVRVTDFDFSGAQATLTMRTDYGGDVLFTATIGDGITIDGDIARINKACAAPPGDHVYDFEIVKAVRRTYLRGKVTVLPEVTSD